MKRILSTIIFSLLFCAVLSAQTIDKIASKCKAPYTGQVASVLVWNTGDIYATPCPTKRTQFQGIVDFTGATVVGIAGSGTVTSVGLTAPLQFNVTGSPVTSTGTFNLAWATATQHTFFAGPSASNGTPTFRNIVASDLPNTTVTAGSYTATNLTVDAQGRITSASSGSGGGVTSVGLSAPTEFSIAGSPITSSGTLALSWGSNSSKLFLATPNGGSGVPSLRAIFASDLPNTAVTPASYTCTNLTVDAQGRITTAANGSCGGGGTPGGSNTQVQYNNSGAFGGIAGFTTDGNNVTAGSGNLRATSPRITTGIFDANGNNSLALTATASAVNYLTLANSAAASSPTISATGTDTDIDVNITPKGGGGVNFNGSGVGSISIAEGTPSVGTSGYDKITANSSTHRLQASNNGGSLTNLTYASDFGANVGTFLATPTGANFASAITTPVPASVGGTGLSSLGTGVATFLGTPSGSNLASALTSALPASAGGTGITALGTGVATALGVNTGSTGAFGVTISSGTSALGTGAISSATCATVVTTSATGTATTDVIWWGFNADPTALTGYTPSTNGMLTIVAYPTTNNVNFKVCNNTTGSITPSAVTLNWRIVR